MIIKNLKIKFSNKKPDLWSPKEEEEEEEEIEEGRGEEEEPRETLRYSNRE